MNRVSRHDGGVSGLLAYLDDDEDGLIALTTFKALLRREDVFEAIPEDQVVDLLAPMMQDHKNLRAAALLRFVEGSKMKAQRGAGEGKEADEDTIVLPKEYVFSTDPERRAVEKKVQGFGRVLAKKGVDVESMFRKYDPKSTGAVRRTELLEVLSKLGMYLLEQGRVLDEAAAGGNDIQRMQMHQVNRLKGKGGDYLQNAPRMARRMLMNGGDRAPEGDFKVLQ
jgi:Ca2+-binding EF-hand superfamily protein